MSTRRVEQLTLPDPDRCTRKGIFGAVCDRRPHPDDLWHADSRHFAWMDDGEVEAAMRGRAAS